MENNLKNESVSEKKARKRQQTMELSVPEKGAGVWTRVKTAMAADWQKWAMTLLALVFAAFLFIDFGNFSMPDSYFRFERKYEPGSGQILDNEVIVKLNYMKDENEKTVLLDEVWVHAGATGIPAHETATLAFSYGISSAPSNWLTSQMGTVKFCDSYGDTNFRMYKWTQLYSNVKITSESYAFVKIATKDPIYINEIVFLDKNMNPIPVEVVSGDSAAKKMFDEQANFKYTVTQNEDGTYEANVKNHRMNTIIFDEYYFARTAFDYLQGDAPYVERSHPPLGKILLSIGIGIFGLNTFGMRIMPALFALATMFVVYALGKRLVKNSKTAGFIFALLYVLSGMNIALGRIGTTDIFLMFFLLLSYYYMLIFLQNGIRRDHRILSFVPLVLSGVFFGMGAAVKWSGITAGVGLFGLFVYFFIKNLVCGVKRTKALAAGTVTEGEGEQALPAAVAAAKEKSNVIKDAIWSVVFAGVGFIILGFAMYLLSYLIVGPSYCMVSDTKNVLKAFWENQKYIMGFHTGNMSGDNNSSAWWGWPINYQAVCFSIDQYSNKTYEGVLCMGNMIAFAFSLVAMIYTLVEMCIVKFSKKANQEDVAFVSFVKKPFVFLLVSFAACYLPWMFVTRPMYAYTFLTASVFYVGFLALFLCAVLETKKNVILRGPFKGKTVGGVMVFTTLALVGLCFLMFYPGFAGLPVPRNLAKVLFGWSCLNHGDFLP